MPCGQFWGGEPGLAPIGSEGEVAELAEHFVDGDEGVVGHLFASADADPTDGGVGAVAAFGRSFDRGEVHVVPIAVTDKYRLHGARTFLQS